MYFFDLEDYAAFFRASDFTEHFNCNGYYNGKQSWLSDDGLTKIIWDNTMTPNCWSLSGDSFNTIKVINTNPAQPPINGNWTVVGLTYNVVSNQGDCPPPAELNMNVTKNNPTCTCNGSITILGSGGVPPYQYSYDNGVTYGNSAIKNGLCGDIQLTVMIRDSEGTVKSQLVQMAPQIQEVNYQISVEVLGSTIISQSQPFNAIYEYGITITPPLPNGVTMTFDLINRGAFYRTPSPNSATGSMIPVLTKNGNNIPYSNNNTTNSQIANTNSGCQSYTKYVTNYEYSYINLTITNTDVMRLTITQNLMGTCQSSPSSNQSLSENNDESLGPLGYAQYASNSYLNCCDYSLNIIYPELANATLSNCSCCTISYGKSLYE